MNGSVSWVFNISQDFKWPVMDVLVFSAAIGLSNYVYEAYRSQYKFELSSYASADQANSQTSKLADLEFDVTSPKFQSRKEEMNRWGGRWMNRKRCLSQHCLHGFAAGFKVSSRGTSLLRLRLEVRRHEIITDRFIYMT